MSEIKQYGARGPLSDPPILGEYIMVTYDDHLVALNACEERVLAAAVQRVQDMAIPHHFHVAVTSAVWNQVIGECIAAIKGDSDD